MKVVKGLKFPKEHGCEFSSAAVVSGWMRATLSRNPASRHAQSGKSHRRCLLPVTPSPPYKPFRLAAEQSARWELPRHSQVPAGLAVPQLVQTCVFLQVLGLHLLPECSEIWLQRRKWGYFLGNGKLSRWKT